MTQILNHIIEIKSDLSAIKQHLADLNGKVMLNQTRIEENRTAQESIKITLAKWGGVFAVLFSAIQYFIYKI